MRRYIRRTDLTDAERTKLDFVVGVHGPLMKEVALATRAFIGSYNRTHSRRICGGHPSLGRDDPNFKDISLIEDPAKLPDVIGATCFGEFFGRQFLDRYARTGFFEPVDYPAPPIPLFEGVDLVDPTGSFHVFGGCAFEMLVDTRKLEGRPVPHTWADLLDPRYRDMVVCGFNVDDINEYFLLYYYRFFGAEGLAAFAENLAAPVDTLDMMRTSLRTRNRHAILLLPHFFAVGAPQEDYLVHVWPEDGALLAPYALLAHNTSDQRVRDIVGFFLGHEFASALDGTDLPTMPGKKSFHIYSRGLDPVYETRRFKWLGWDWVMERDIVETMRTIDGIVTPIVLRKHPELRSDIGRALWNG